MLAEIPPEQFAAVLDDVAQETLDAVGIEGPPVDMFQVARRMGITLAWDEGQRVRGRYVRLSVGQEPAAAILLRPEPRPQRLQWAVAHEIGEHVAHRVFSELAVDPREVGTDAREAVANRLAGRFLLPTAWFSADGARCGWDLPALVARYSTASHELAARRMLEQPPPVIITIFDQGRVSFRRSNLPGRVPPVSEAERRCRLAAHDQGRPQHVAEEMLRIDGWPVHEPGWKREILRTEMDPDPFC